jgi:hypothetical protein
VRTGVVVFAFGLVIEKFDLFLLTLLDAASLDASLPPRFKVPMALYFQRRHDRSTSRSVLTLTLNHRFFPPGLRLSSGFRPRPPGSHAF